MFINHNTRGRSNNVSACDKIRFLACFLFFPFFKKGVFDQLGKIFLGRTLTWRPYKPYWWRRQDMCLRFHIVHICSGSISTYFYVHILRGSHKPSHHHNTFCRPSERGAHDQSTDKVTTHARRVATHHLVRSSPRDMIMDRTLVARGVVVVVVVVVFVVGAACRVVSCIFLGWTQPCRIYTKKSTESSCLWHSIKNIPRVISALAYLSTVRGDVSCWTGVIKNAFNAWTQPRGLREVNADSQMDLYPYTDGVLPGWIQWRRA